MIVVDKLLVLRGLSSGINVTLLCDMIKRQSPLFAGHEGVWGNGSVPPLILNLGFRCVWRSTSGPDRLYNEGKNPGCLLSRGFDGPQNRSDRFAEERIVSSLAGIEPQFRKRPGNSQVS